MQTRQISEILKSKNKGKILPNSYKHYVVCNWHSEIQNDITLHIKYIGKSL